MKCIRGVLLLAAAVGLVACGSDANSKDAVVTQTKTVVVTDTTPTAPAAFTPYANDTYSAEIPTGWTLKDGAPVDQGTYTEAKWISPDDGTTFVKIDVNNTPVTDTPAQSAASVRDAFSQTPGYRELSFADADISGRQGFVWQFQAEGDQRVDYFFNDCGQTGFAMLGSTDGSRAAELQATFQHVAESVAANCETGGVATSTTATTPQPASDCEPSVPSPPGPCLPPFTGDASAIDCPHVHDLGYSDITVLPPDPYHLDGSPPEEAGSPNFEPPDGVGCETYP